MYRGWVVRHQRGYGSGGTSCAKVILVRDGYLCLTCLALGIYTPATTVDHVVARRTAEQMTPAIWRPFVIPCHGVKTAKERLKGRQT